MVTPRSTWHKGLASLAVGVLLLTDGTARGQITPGANNVEMLVRPVELNAPANRIRDALRSGEGLASGNSIRLRDGRWYVRIRRAPNGGNGVPWEIRYENHPESEIQDLPAAQFDPDEHVLRIPVLPVPNGLWDNWFAEKLQDVAGIHYPRMERRNPSRLLLTVHPEPTSTADESASRIEATLLVPITWSIDQAIIVRRTAHRPEVDARLHHERAHAVSTVMDLVESIVGPQTWDNDEASGRRSGIKWLWRYEMVTGTVDWYRDGKKKLRMLRTYVTVVPPSRWSMRLAKSRSEITPEEMRAFNVDILNVGARYARRREAQRDEVHKKLGVYAAPELPKFRSGRRP